MPSSPTNLANMLGDLGQSEDALNQALEAFAQRRRLGDALGPDQAASLNIPANARGTVGRPEEALKAAEQAVAQRRQLAAERPDAQPDLAASLINLAYGLNA